MASDAVKAETARLVADMDRAVRDAGISPGDPMAPLLEVLRRALAWQGDMTAENVRLSVESSRVAADMGEQVRKAFADARMITPHGEQELVRRVAGMAGGAVREAMVRVFRSLRWGTVAGLVVAALVLLGVAGGAGYLLGRRNGLVTLQVTDQAGRVLCAGKPPAP